MSRLTLLVLLVAGRAIAAPAQPEDAPVPAIEPTVGAAGTLPPLPSFELPPAEPGFEDPRRLRVAGRKLLDTKVKVKGYIIWAYNCVEDVRGPKEPAAKTQKRIDEDPTLCERPKFYLGESKTTPREKGVWVVDVPRPPNKLEKQRLPKAELKSWPKVPKYKVGDYVVVTGDFKIRSTHAEVNTDGLIIFESLAAAKPPKKAPVAAPAPTDELPPRVAPSLKPARLALLEPTKRGQSMTALKNGTLALGKRQYIEAVKAYREAVTAWPQNHAAWYGMGGALAAQSMWEAAHEAFGKAVAIHPDVAMYQMWHGVAAYEKAVQLARVQQAGSQGLKPDQISVDLSTIKFDDAYESLETALALEPSLWRAHYYQGRIHRNADQPIGAARELAEAIKLRADEIGPWIALGELYRRWDYTNEAIEVMKVAVLSVKQDASASDVWYVLAMAYDDKSDYTPAIAAFTKALDLKADNAKALFQRGQAYFKAKKYDEAKVDLEAFTKVATTPQLGLAKRQAEKMLMDIAIKPAAKPKK